MSRPPAAAWVAFAAVCFFWGTTYVAIRMALESFPPLFLLTTRFLLSGSLMLAGAVLSRATLPRGRELWRTAACGVLALGVGNGCLVYAETWVPSGLAALFITTSPYWMVGLEAALPGGERLHAPTLLGLLVGLGGVLLLINPFGIEASGSGWALLQGFGLLQVGCAGWALGSLLQRRSSAKAHPIVGAAVQQLATGFFYLLPALLVNERPVHWDVRSVGVLAYLVTFGSIVGYSAFVYAMAHLPVAVVSIYSYVNPAVAVVLGWLFYGERFGWREATAMLLIFAGVALVKRAQGRVPASPSPAPLRPALHPQAAGRSRAGTP